MKPSSVRTETSLTGSGSSKGVTADAINITGGSSEGSLVKESTPPKSRNSRAASGKTLKTGVLNNTRDDKAQAINTGVVAALTAEKEAAKATAASARAVAEQSRLEQQARQAKATAAALTAEKEAAKATVLAAAEKKKASDAKAAREKTASRRASIAPSRSVTTRSSSTGAIDYATSNDESAVLMRELNAIKASRNPAPAPTARTNTANTNTYSPAPAGGSSSSSSGTSSYTQSSMLKQATSNAPVYGASDMGALNLTGTGSSRPISTGSSGLYQ